MKEKNGYRRNERLQNPPLINGAMPRDRFFLLFIVLMRCCHSFGFFFCSSGGSKSKSRFIISFFLVLCMQKRKGSGGGGSIVFSLAESSGKKQWDDLRRVIYDACPFHVVAATAKCAHPTWHGNICKRKDLGQEETTFSSLFGRSISSGG